MNLGKLIFSQLQPNNPDVSSNFLRFSTEDHAILRHVWSLAPYRKSRLTWSKTFLCTLEDFLDTVIPAKIPEDYIDKIVAPETLQTYRVFYYQCSGEYLEDLYDQKFTLTLTDQPVYVSFQMRANIHIGFYACLARITDEPEKLKPQLESGKITILNGAYNV